MVDYNKLKIAGKSDFVQYPYDIFNRLPKPEHVDDLHQSQAEVLDRWYKNKGDHKDFVVKLHTGGGKTLVGLLMALSTASELKKGALYLVDNRQLADQVVRQAAEFGIPAMTYEGRASVDARFRNGDSILVASYEALFNGMSVFGKLHDVEYEDVGIIIFDDAHSAFSAVRDSFTVSVCADEDEALYKEICRLFRKDFEKIDRLSTFDDFTGGVKSIASEILEVPFWAWIDNSQSVASLLSEKYQSLPAQIPNGNKTMSSLKFAWPLIKDELRYCRAMISADSFTVTSYLPIVDMFPTYSRAPRRIFMSATFADDGAIIRAFEPENDVLPMTISSQTLAGVGRRMILPFDESMLSSGVIMQKMMDTASSGKGAVVLTTSSSRADSWGEVGAIAAHKFGVAGVVANLREGLIDTPVAFANRYNGIDLPRDSCRLLLIDGIPKGSSDYERLSASTLSSSSLYSRTIAQTLEQAIGRGTRGSGDYCAVILAGKELCEWVKDKRHLQYFSLPTRAQILCGEEVMENITSVEEYMETLDQGINGDHGFASYLSDYVGNYLEANEEVVDEELVKFATDERRAFRAWRHGAEGKAHAIARSFAENEENDDDLRGYMFQLAAQISYSCGDYATASELQNRAHGCNRALIRSIALIDDSVVSQQAQRIVERLTEIECKRSDALAVFDEETEVLLKDLTSEGFEQGLERLGFFLGLESERFDAQGVGPDVLWRFPADNYGIILEVKSDKKSDNPLAKKEHGQLLVAEKWFHDTYPDCDCMIASVHPNDEAYHNASATSTHVLTLEGVVNLRSKIRLLWQNISSCPPSEKDRLAKCDVLLDEYNLNRESVIPNYFTLFSVAEPRKK